MIQLYRDPSTALWREGQSSLRMTNLINLCLCWARLARLDGKPRRLSPHGPCLYQLGYCALLVRDGGESGFEHIDRFVHLRVSND